MNAWEACLLGIVQGITEFLPISSDGHLVLAEHLLNLQVSQFFSFDIMLHMATLLAVLLFFGRQVGRLCQAGAGFVIPRCNTPEVERERRLIPAILISTVITGVLGLMFKDPIENMRDQMDILGLYFILTGLFLYATKLVRPKGSDEGGGLPDNLWLFAVLMGIGQSLAILPGVSRSGTTIGLALLVGAGRTAAVEYSFLMSIPAILGAVVLAIKDMEWNFTLPIAAAGFTSALAAGLLSLWLLVLITRKGKIHRFAYYVIPLGIWVRWLSL